MSSWEHLETASNIVRRRNPPRIPWATTLHLSFRTRDDSKVDQKFVIRKIPCGQVRGAKYVLPREIHKGQHGHQLGNGWLVVLQPFSGHLTWSSPAYCTWQRAAARNSLQGHISPLHCWGKIDSEDKTTTSINSTLTWSTAPRAQRSRIQGTQMALERRSVDLKLLDARRRKTLRRSRGKFVKYEFR